MVIRTKANCKGDGRACRVIVAVAATLVGTGAAIILYGDVGGGKHGSGKHVAVETGSVIVRARGSGPAHQA